MTQLERTQSLERAIDQIINLGHKDPHVGQAKPDKKPDTLRYTPATTAQRSPPNR